MRCPAVSRQPLVLHQLGWGWVRLDGCIGPGEGIWEAHHNIHLSMYQGVAGVERGWRRQRLKNVDDPEVAAKAAPLDFIGDRKLLTDLREDYSSHHMKDDWREQNPYPDMPAQQLLQELGLKIRARQCIELDLKGRDKYAEYLQNLMTTEQRVSGREESPLHVGI